MAVATFKDLALQYVLADDEASCRDAASKAAQEIEKSKADRTVVGSWASSIHQWMGCSGGDETGDMNDRAKALSFLSDTLEKVDDGILSADQVQLLASFFGSMFSNDQKAGIRPAAKSLERLAAMKKVRPDTALQMMEDVVKIKEDFRRQLPVTRLEICRLLQRQLQDAAVRRELMGQHSSPGSLITALVELCRNERDPSNLMVWFCIWPILLADYAPSRDQAETVFKAFSAYFPIDLRSSTAAGEVTAEHLKDALRGCFSCDSGLAPLAFPFLVEKLEQGGLSVAVKLDVLKTLQSCVKAYKDPRRSVAPHLEQIWTPLRHEVRFDEVEETIKATLELVRDIANRLDGTKDEKLEPCHLDKFIGLVWNDCRADMAKPVHLKQVGLVLVTVATANIRGFLRHGSKLFDLLRQRMNEARWPLQRTVILRLVNAAIGRRSDLVNTRAQAHPDDVRDLVSEKRTWLPDLYSILASHLPTGPTFDLDAAQAEMIAESCKGLALVISQEAVQADGAAVLLACPAHLCSEACRLLAGFLFAGFPDPHRKWTSAATRLADEAALALRSVVTSYGEGFGEVVSWFMTGLANHEPPQAGQSCLEDLQVAVTRLAYIGCSQIPKRYPHGFSSGLWAAAPKKYSALQHLETVVSHFLAYLSTHDPGGPKCHLAAVQEVVLAGLHCAVLHFQDAYAQKVAEPSRTGSGDATGSRLVFDPLEDQPLGSGWEMQGSEVGEHNYSGIRRRYFGLGLSVVRHLYRLAIRGGLGMQSEGILVQTGSLAASVIKHLDETTQKSCGLALAYEDLIMSNQPQEARDPDKFILRLGMIEGLWPGAMSELYTPGGLAENLMSNMDPAKAPASPRTAYARATTGAILANKFQPTGEPASCMTMETVLESWAQFLQHASSCPPVTAEQRRDLEARYCLFIHVLAGCVARMDRAVVELTVPALHRALCSASDNNLIGDTIASSMGVLVKGIAALTAENHAVTKSLYKQWTYRHFAQPLYAHTLLSPGGNAASAARRCTIAILAIVRHAPFGAYEADLDRLTPLLIRALSPSSSSSSSSSSALAILSEILAREPDRLSNQLKALVDGACKAYLAGLDSRTPSIRREALRLLVALPASFRTQYVLPYAPQMRRALARASGDPSRQLRKVAVTARGLWAKVGE